MKMAFSNFLSIIPGNFILTLKDIDRIQQLCAENDLEEIKVIFQNKKIRFFSLPCQKILNLVFDSGYMEIAQYLLNSADTKEFQKTKLDEPLILACLKRGDKGAEMAQYILSKPELINRIDLTKLNEHVLSASCQSMNLPIIKFVLEDNKLNSYINLNHNGDEFFKNLFYFRKMEFINYLIYDIKIKRTTVIDEILEHGINSEDFKNEGEYVKYMFDVRDLKKELDIGLLSKNDNKPKKQVKI